MLKFFDYVHYACCHIYEKKEGEEPAGIGGLALLSLLQTLNIILLSGFFYFLFPSFPFNKYWVVPVYVFFLVVNGLHHNKVNYKFLKEKLAQEDTEIRTKKLGLARWYMVLSVVLLLLLFLFMAIKNKIIG